MWCFLSNISNLILNKAICRPMQMKARVMTISGTNMLVSIDGDDNLLKPMILKDISKKIDMDISTVSRIVSSKVIQTDFGIFPLKFFFSEAHIKKDGEIISSKKVKNLLKKLISEEDKREPYSDEKLEKILNKKGYNIARRTISKYREQLNIAVSRLRRDI